MTFVKIFLLLGVLLLANAYTEENNVLILTDMDLPGVISEFPYILIEFYAPWCGHCKKLTPIFDQVATELKAAGVNVRLAKIDADKYSTVKGPYEVKGFPTLYFYSNGQKIKYSGQRTKDFLINWLSKKTGPAVNAIEAAQIEALAENGKVNVVFHGDLAAHEQGKLFEEIATADDYNSYHSISSSEQPAGTIQIIRPFGESVSTLADAELRTWIQKHERPTVFAFDDRTIGDIFGERGVGVILFQSASAGGDALNQAFVEAAHTVRVEQGKSLIFTSIEASAEHFSGLANYIKILTEKSPVVVIDGGNRLKYVLTGSPSDITAQQIVDFVAAVEGKTAKEYKIDEEVTYEDKTKVEDEL